VIAAGPPPQAVAIPSLWIRFGARFVDELIMSVPRLALTLPYVRLDAERGLAFEPPGWVLAMSVLVPLLYDFVSVAWRGATPGKAVFGLTVRRAGDVGRVAPDRAALRAAVPLLGSALLLVAPEGELAFLLMMVAPAVYATASLNPLRRGLHDLAAGTIVIRSDRGLPNAENSR